MIKTIEYLRDIVTGAAGQGFIGYQHSSADISASIVDPSLSINDKLNVDFTRSWWTLALRAGFDL